MLTRLLGTCTLFLLSSIVFAYYGDPNNLVEIPGLTNAGSVAVGDKVYIIGGTLVDGSQNNDIFTLGFTPNGTLEVNRITPNNALEIDRITTQGPQPFFFNPKHGYALPDNNTIVAVNSFYNTFYYPSTDTSILSLGLAFYDIAENTWSFPDGLVQSYSMEGPEVPFLKRGFSSVISPQFDAVFVFGGFNVDAKGKPLFSSTTDILRFDLKNPFNIINLTATNPKLSITDNGGSSIMLP
jgi:hypothetical protein